MKNAVARFFCWLFAIASMLASIIIIAGPILDHSINLMEFFKIPWCIAALLSPYVLMVFFSMIRGENFLHNLLFMLIPLAALGLAIIFAINSTLDTSEAEFCGILYFLAVLANVITSFCLFAQIINEDDGSDSSTSGGSGSDYDYLDCPTGDEGYVDTTGLWP